MKNAKHFRELFEEIYNSGDEILNNTTGETFEAEEDEEFVQCWADTPTRCLFPKYWFISQYENLLSVKKDRIVWLNKNRREKSNKISYKFMVHTENGTKIKNVEAHDLVGLVWGSESFGLATKLLEEKGLDAIGVSGCKDNPVHGHHKNLDDTDNSPGNIKFVTDRVHMALGKAAKLEVNDTAEKHFEYMDELAEVMNEENPNAFTVVLDGNVYDKETGLWSKSGDCDVLSVDRINISREAMQQLQGLGIYIG